MTTVRKQKSGDQLTVGDWLAPGELMDDAAEVLFTHAYSASADRSRDNNGKHVRLVLRALGKAETYSDIVSGTTLFGLASDEDLAEYRTVAGRAQKIADIRAFADWLEANLWAPTPEDIEATVHLDGEQAYATLRQVADRLGVERNERQNDYSDARKMVGSVGYTVVAWHKDGRPAEPAPESPDPDAVCLGRDMDCGRPLPCPDHPAEPASESR